MGIHAAAAWATLSNKANFGVFGPVMGVPLENKANAPGTMMPNKANLPRFGPKTRVAVENKANFAECDCAKQTQSTGRR